MKSAAKQLPPAKPAHRAKPGDPATFGDAVFEAASFRCAQVHQNVQLTPWVRGVEKTAYDKIYLITGGRGWLILDDRHYSLRPGMAFLIPVGTLQRGDGEGLEILWTHFSAHTADRLPLLPLVRLPECVKGATARRLLPEMQSLLDVWRRRPAGYALSLQSSLQRQLLHLLNVAGRNIVRPDKNVLLPPQSPVRAVSSADGRSLLPALERMLRDYPQPLTLPELAESVHLSTAYFCDRFRQYAGLSPMRFLELHRIRRAQELLSGRELTVQQIARLVGYPDPYHFSRIFKRVTGESPTACRERASRA